VKEGEIIRIAACSLEYRLAVRPQPQHLRKLPFSDTRSSQASPRAGITGVPPAQDTPEQHKSIRPCISL